MCDYTYMFIEKGWKETFQNVCSDYFKGDDCKYAFLYSLVYIFTYSGY